jgi:hypothetical protein
MVINPITIELFPLPQTGDMMNKFLIVIAILIGVAGCHSVQQPTIAINLGRDAGYFNGVCNYQDALAKQGYPNTFPCNRGSAHDVENAFQTAFLANPSCAGIRITNVEDLQNYPANTHVITFNAVIARDGSVDVKDSEWHLIVPDATGLVNDPNDASTIVCRIVKGEGGTSR